MHKMEIEDFSKDLRFSLFFIHNETLNQILYTVVPDTLYPWQLLLCHPFFLALQEGLSIDLIALVFLLDLLACQIFFAFFIVFC